MLPPAPALLLPPGCRPGRPETHERRQPPSAGYPYPSSCDRSSVSAHRDKSGRPAATRERRAACPLFLIGADRHGLTRRDPRPVVAVPTEAFGSRPDSACTFLPSDLPGCGETPGFRSRGECRSIDRGLRYGGRKLDPPGGVYGRHPRAGCPRHAVAWRASAKRECDTVRVPQR